MNPSGAKTVETRIKKDYFDTRLVPDFSTLQAKCNNKTIPQVLFNYQNI